MSKRNAFVRYGLTVAAVLLVCRPLLRSQSRALPPGPIQEKVATACLECHDSSIILQQRLGKGAWTREVDKMVKWGAVVDPADRDAFIDYLSTSLPPDKPAETMPRVRLEGKR